MVLFLEESRNKFCKEEKWRGNYNRQMRQIAHLKMWGGCNLQPHWLLFPKTRDWWIHLVFSINHTPKAKFSNLGGTQTLMTRRHTADRVDTFHYRRLLSEIKPQCKEMGNSGRLWRRMCMCLSRHLWRRRVLDDRKNVCPLSNMCQPA